MTWKMLRRKGNTEYKIVLNTVCSERFLSNIGFYLQFATMPRLSTITCRGHTVAHMPQLRQVF